MVAPIARFFTPSACHGPIRLSVRFYSYLRLVGITLIVWPLGHTLNIVSDVVAQYGKALAQFPALRRNLASQCGATCTRHSFVHYLLTWLFFNMAEAAALAAVAAVETVEVAPSCRPWKK